MRKSHKKTVKRSRKSIVKKSYRRVSGGYVSGAHKHPKISKMLSKSSKSLNLSSVPVEKVTPRIVDSAAPPIYGAGQKTPPIESIIAHIN